MERGNKYYEVTSNKKRVLLDCGSNDFRGLSELIRHGRWKFLSVIEAFEPNPLFDLALAVQSLQFRLGRGVNFALNNKAIWTYDGEIEFSQEFRNDRFRIDTDDTPDFRTSEPPDAEGSFITYADPILVECVDFSRILKRYKDFETIVKMDIEGAEYDVLRHVIKEDTAKLMDAIFVEWHHSSMTNEDDNSTQEIVEQLKDVGVQVFDWH